MDKEPPHDQWRVRDPDQVTHWTDRPGAATASISTRCRRTLGQLYKVGDPRSWVQQFAFVPSRDVTCIACLDAGPEPEYVESSYDYGYDTGDFERPHHEEDVD
jgi:hypothetical protein